MPQSLAAAESSCKEELTMANTIRGPIHFWDKAKVKTSVLLLQVSN